MENDSFVDGLGHRVRSFDPAGGEVETLYLCRELSQTGATEAALVARASRLAAFAHPAFAAIRRVERIHGDSDGLAVVSAAVPGTRLSDILRHASEKGVVADPGAVRCLLWQVSVAMADFHRRAQGLAHGALGPERVVVGPNGQSVIVEHLLAPALEQLGMSRTSLWTTFRIPVPAGTGAARFDQVTDVVQLGMLALALVLGRPVGRDEYPQHIQRLLAEAGPPADPGQRPIVSRAMRAWLLRALHVQPRSSFRTAAEAAAAFEDVLADEPRQRSSPAEVVAYLDAALSRDGEASRPLAGGPTPISPGACTDGDRVGADQASGPMTGAQAKCARGASQEPEESLSQQVSSAAASEGQAPTPRRNKFGWDVLGWRLRAATLSLGLIALFGLTYFGAHGHAGWPVGSHGRTPVSLSLPAGEHSLVLRAGGTVTPGPAPSAPSVLPAPHLPQ